MQSSVTDAVSATSETPTPRRGARGAWKRAPARLTSSSRPTVRSLERTSEMISENLRRCVCFVYRTRQGDTLRTPFGTAFLVVVIEQAAGAPLPIWYAVTASHVVSPVDMRGESHDLYLRWPHRAGEADQFEPIDPDKWQRHPDADLAITRVRRSDLVASNQRPRAYWPIFSTQLAGADHLLRPEVGEGDTVFMVGLFSSHPGSQQPQPIYRFGNVALMPREPVRIALPGGVGGATSRRA